MNKLQVEKMPGVAMSPSPLSLTIEVIQKESSILEEAIAGLENKLSSVMTAEPGATACDVGDQEKLPRSVIVETLDLHVNALRSFRERLNSMAERLEV